MRKLFIILLAIIGFIISPVISHACNVNIKKKCCSKEMSSSSDVKKCCKDSKSNKNTPNNCDGKCKNACSSSSVHIAFITFTHTELSTPVFSFYAKKEKIYTTESFVSSNFYAIWLPPKIG